ncbi:putative sensor-like histidine kinase [compost metagenome]
MISVDIELDIVENLVARLFDSKKEELYILDKEGRVVYSSEDSLVGGVLNEPWAHQIVMSTESLGSLELNTAEFSGITIYSKIESSMVEWTIVKRVPDASLYANARQLGLINSWVAIIFLVVALAAMVVVSYHFTKPIKELIRWSNAIQAGKLEETININRTDEIGSLARRFKSMMQTINELILRGYKLSLANKTNELKILQAQINPHFMYNSLQSIGALALEYKVPKVYMLLMSMGQIMHYSMNSKETTVPLSKEMEYVHYYLVLQKQRFEDDLYFDMHVDEETKNIAVPKMIVQPIVENYFKHGKHSSALAGHIKIHTYLDDEVLTIVVEDNGIGIQEEKLRQLRSELSRIQNSAIDRTEHIGLMNVLNRLRLYHGNQAELELENIENGGLKVTILIPLYLNGEDESTKSST